MTTLFPQWPDPPHNADSEVEGVLAALERQRATFWWKVSGLDTDRLRTPHPPSALTLARLLKHLAQVEDKLASVLAARPASEPWAAHGGHASGDAWAWTWQSAHDDAAPDLHALWERSVLRARAALADELARGDLSGRARSDRGPTVRTPTSVASSSTRSRSMPGTSATPT